MAEVAFEQFTSRFELSVVGNILSFSPGTLVSMIPVTTLLLVSLNAVNHSRNVRGSILWCTESVIWNQVSSIVKGACAWAVFFGSISWAVIPVSIACQVGVTSWMAELFGEESCHVKWCAFVSVPFALSSAARLVLGVLAAHAVHCGILADVCN
jgi:hypothetical protein